MNEGQLKWSELVKVKVRAEGMVEISIVLNNCWMRYIAG